MEALTPLDTAFLELEERDESAHMHIGWAMLFDPVPGGGTPSVQELRGQLERRLELLPRFRRRLSSPRTGRLSWPSWQEDEGFDVAHHVRRATLSSPGGRAELLEWLGDFYSHRLDRAHPLWEMTLLEGLEGGCWAIAAKVHHSLVDGMSGSSVTTAILDAEPDPGPDSMGVLEALEQAVEEERGRGRLAAVAERARSGIDVALHPRRLGALFSRSREMAALLVDEVVAAPSTSLNVRIGGSRRLEEFAVPLDDLKAIKRELGGTVNDVVLAIVAGGLNRLFAHRGESLGGRTLRAMVPVSVRAAGESLALGNRVTSLFVELYVEEPDPLLRYRKTAAAAEDLKAGGQAAGGETLVELAGMAPPLVHGVVAQLAFTPRLFNLTITNVPGPQMTLYAFGAPLRHVIPLVPIFAGHALGVAAVSYDGEVTFGLNADRAKVPDLEVFREGIEESLSELRRAASEASPREKALSPTGRRISGAAGRTA
jgi:WS/DGAT/MGAT family acyltransferase